MSIVAIAVLALVGTILYRMNPEDRERLGQVLVARAKQTVHDVRHGPTAADPLHERLLARTRWPIVSPLLIAGVTWVWFSRPVAWGASSALRTTNGEWWRVVSYAFVHNGFLHLIVAVAALATLGLTLERFVGRVAFAGVYLAATVAAGVVTLWTSPAGASAIGSSGAVLGLYGLLVAVVVYGYLRKPRLPWSSLAAKRVAIGAVPFLLYNVFTNHLSTVGELAGLGTGLLLGLSLARRTVSRKPRVQRAILVPATVSVIAFAIATPLRGTVDARPAIERVALVETWTALEYAKGAYEVSQGKRSQKGLAQLIDKTIVPALEKDRARIEAMGRVPREQQELVEATRDYFTLREHSWRRRQAAVATSSAKTQREADDAERLALSAFDRIQRILGTRQTEVVDLTAHKASAL
jgi:membrane associated rhomboid family serine protease